MKILCSFMGSLGVASIEVLIRLEHITRSDYSLKAQSMYKSI